MPYIPNVVQRSLSLLASQFRGTNEEGNLTNFQKLLKVFLESSQNIQDVINQLKTQRNIFDAVGVQLDGIGEILGLQRESGESDEDYRERLQFQTFINSGTGTPEEVIRVLAFLTNASKVGYIEYYPGAYQMSTDGTTFPDPPEELVTAINRASPAGIQYVPVTASYGVEKPFVFGLDFEEVPLWVTDPNDPEELTNIELDTSEILYVNPANRATSRFGGGFAEAIWTNDPTTPIIYDFDTTGAGRLAEVIMRNGSQAPQF